MNSTYKLVFSAVLNAWVAVAEHVRGRGKQGTVRLLSAAAVLAGGAGLGTVGTMGTAWAQAGPPPAAKQLPTGAQVAAGSVSISQSQTATAASMAINQSSAKAIVNWQTFNVGANAKVNITQPSSTSVLLNRVQSSDPSQIFGQIKANGQVFLTNPNGVYFAPGSSVDVGSFTATTHGISDADFLSGNYQFSRNGAAGSIVNQGSLTAGLGGYIALLAPEVRNQGVVVAQLGGTVALAAGESYQLQLSSNGQLTNVLVTPATIQTLVDNGNAVQAPGGLIILSAQAASGLLGGVVKNSGAISATGLVSDGGTIRLSASHKIELAPTSSISADAAANSAGNGGRIDIIADLNNASSSTQVDGSISAKGGEQGGDGGFIETSATLLKIADSARVSTLAPRGQAGNWLLDPNDFEVSSTGNISGSTLSTLLGSGNVTLQAGTGTDTSTAKFGNVSTTGNKGNINIYDAVSWSANTLTLNAGYNINVGSNSSAGSLTVTGSGSLYLNPSSSLVAGYTAGGAVLMGMAASPTSGLITSNQNGFNGQINVSSTATNPIKINGINYTVINGVAGLNAITTSAAGTNNRFDTYNNGYYVLGSDITSDLTTSIIAANKFFAGYFNGFGHTVNVALTNGNNGLFSSAYKYNFSNLGVKGSIASSTAGVAIGGILGTSIGTSDNSNEGTVSNSYNAATITHAGNNPRLAGIIASANVVTLSNVYNAGSITVTSGTWGPNAGYVVGLVGFANTVIATNVYNTGAMNTTGLTVSGVAGLFGYVGGSNGGGITGGSIITNAYNTGNITVGPNSIGIGGIFAIQNWGPSKFTNIYSSGSVTAGTGSTAVGIIGGMHFDDSTKNITSTFYNSSNASSVGGAAITNPFGTVWTNYGLNNRLNCNTLCINSSPSATTYYSVTPLTTAQMTVSSNFTGFTFSSSAWGYSSVANSSPILCLFGGCVISNTYTGLSGGTWSTASNWSLLFAPLSSNASSYNNIVINSGSTVNLDTASVGSLTTTIANAGTISFTGSSNVTLSGAISGNGAINTAAGFTGSATLSGTNTYSGGTTITAGTLRVGSAAALGSGTVSVTNLAALDLNGQTMTSTGVLTLNGSGISGGGALTNSSSTAATYAGNIVLGSASSIGSAVGGITASGVVSGASTLTKVAAATLTLTGSNTYTGGTTILAGTLKAASSAALGTGAVTLGASAVLDLTFNGTVALGSTLSMAAGSAITNSANTSNLTVAGTSTLAGGINTAGNQTYTGAVTLGANTSISTLNTSSVNTNGTITFGSTVDSSTGNYYGLTVSNGTGTTAFGGVVGGTNPLGYLCINAASCNATAAGTASGNGTTTLAGDITTSGTQTYGGNLTLGANTALTSTANNGNGAVTIAGAVSTAVAGSGYLYLEGLGYTDGTVTATSSTGVYKYGGTTYTLASGSSVTLAIGTLTYSGYSSTNYQSSYIFMPTSSSTSNLLIVGGGGGGGGNIGGGGGAGSVVYGSTSLNGNISIVVGNGGNSDSNGYSSSVTIGSTTYTALGGGRGTNPYDASYSATGGSGGGFRASTSNTGIYRSYQPAVTGMTSLANDGGMGTGGHLGGTGGGGAGSAGGLTSSGGNGGNGGAAHQWLDGNYYAGGGGGASGGSASGYVGIAGTGGGGGAGNGSNGNNSGMANPNSGTTSNAQGYAATHGTGSGGGGGSFNNNGVAAGGAGGSGVVAFTYNALGTYALTINSGSGKASLGGSVSNVSTLTVNSTSQLSELTGAIGGSTALAKTGAGGVLTLSGANTYTGGTTISGGTLKLGHATALGGSGGAVSVANGAALDLNGTTMTNTNALTLRGTGISDGGALTNSSSTAATYAGNVVLGSASSIGSAVGDITASGVVSGAFALSKIGAATLTLTGSNTYTGGTTISAGTLKVGSGSALGSSGGGAISVASLAALDLNGFGLANTNTITLNGTGINSGGALINTSGTGTAISNPIVLGSDTSIGSSTANINLSGVISGNGNLTKIGTAHSTLSGINTYTGTTTVTGGGILAISHAQGLGSTDGGTIVSSSGRLLFNGLSVGAEAIDLNGGSLEVQSGTSSLSGPVTLGANSSVRVDSGAQLTLSGVVSGTGRLTKTSGATVGNYGTLVLTGTNTYSGGTTISLGTLQLGAGGATGSIEGNVTNNATLAFNRSDDLTYANVISGSGAVTKLADNTLTLSGDNTYSSGTTISAGTLKAGSATAMGSGAVSVSDGAALDLNGQTMTSTGVLTLRGTGVSATGALLNSGSTAATYAGALALGANSSIMSGSTITSTISLTNTGALAGGGFILTLGAPGVASADNHLYSIIDNTTAKIIKNGSFFWTFHGNNTYSGGTDINVGTIRAGSPTALGSGAITVASGGSLDLRGQTMTSTGTLSLNGPGFANLGALRNSNTATATYAGPLVLTGNSNVIAQTGAIQLTHTGTITGATFGLTLGGTQGGSIAAIIGTTTGSLTKQDGGTWTLSGANTYTGGSTVNAGTLKMGSATAAGTGPISVSNGGALDLNGQTLTSTGTLTLNGTGVASGGALVNSSSSVGTYAGAVTLASDSSYGGTGAITFGSTVNSASSAAYALSSTSAGNLVFNAAVGASYALSSLSTGTGTTTLGANVTTVGSQTYGGPVVIKKSSGVTLANTNSAITFGATVDSISTTSYALTLSNGTGGTTFTGAIGATDAIGALTVNGTGPITLGGNVSTKGNQSYFGPVSIAAGVTLTANPLTGSSGIITNGNNNDSYYAFGVTGLTSSSITESNYYLVQSGSSSSPITSASNDNLGIMFYNNTGTMNGAGSNNNWCCINYPVLVDAGQSTLLSSLTVVTRGDGMANRVPKAVSVYGSNTPFTSANKFKPFSNNFSNLSVLGTDYQQSNFSLIGSSTLSFSGGGTSSPTLSNTISFTNSATYRYYELVFNSASGATDGGMNLATGVSTSYGLGLALNAINMYGAALTPSAIAFNQAATASGALTVSTGSLTATAISAGGALSISNSGAATVTGAISNNGANAASLVKSGAGTLTLSGTNTYTGGTTVSAGTLQVGAGSTTGSMVGNVSNNATLAFNRSDDTSFAGVISGTGAVSKSGANTLILSGDNTYTGATTVSAGTLQLGDGNTSGAIAGEVINNGTLAFNRSDALNFSGAISGTGAVTKLGTGTTTLSGINTYTGPTTVSTGTLAIGNAAGLGGTAAGTTVASGAALDLQGVSVGAEALTLNGGTLSTSTGTSSLSGAVSLGADSTINVAGASSQLTLSGLVTGARALTKSGAGNLILSRQNTFSGGLTIAAGTATEGTTYNGTSGPFGSGTVTVQTGATLDLNNYNVYAPVTLAGGALVNNATSGGIGQGDVSLGVSLTADSIFGGAGYMNAFTAISSNGYGLVFLGTGRKNLSSVNNTLTSIASGSGVGALDVVNNQALTIGQVTVGGNTYSGINSTGTVSVETRTGDLTLSQNVATTSTASNYSTPALRLAAGSLAAAGTPAGGDVVLSGTPTMSVGSGGVALIYSGYMTTSAARTLWSSLSNKPARYYTSNSDRSRVPTSAVTGYVALYRESPTTLYTLYLPNQRFTYGTPITSLDYCYSSSASSCVPVTATGIPSNTQATALNNLVLPAGTYPSSIGLDPLPVTGYLFAAGNAVNIFVDPKPVTIANTARTTKYNGTSTYSDLANAMAYTVTGLVGLDAVGSVTQTPSGNGLVASNVANAGSFTVTPSAPVLSIGTAGNYTFSYTAATATVNKAELKIIANTDAKFVGETDRAAYSGVRYEGFVAGQTAAVLSGNLTVSRSNASVGAAGTYAGVLSAATSTLSSDNYNITYVPGNYTIVPADQLLIRLADASTTYGTAPSYTLSSVQYKSSTGNTVVDMTSRAAINAGAFTLSDGAGGNTALTLGPLSSSLSSAGQVAAGSYQVGASSITNTSANYSNTVNIVGALTVAQKSLTVAATSGLSKSYDGSTSMSNLGLALTGLVGADAVTASGLGTYANASAGSSKTFAVSGITLGGTDAANYKLAAPTLSASTGVITAAPLLITANNDSKTYDATAYAASAGVSYSGFVNGESAADLGGSLTYGGSAIGAVNVGNYVITPGGQTSSNYAIAFGNGTLNISPADVRVSATNVTLTGTVAKEYDGTDVATLTPGNYVTTGWLGSDGATITQTTGTYDNANAGTNKLVSVTLTSSDYSATNGTLLSNYNLPTTASGYVGVIAPKTVTVTNAPRSTTYDGVSTYVTLATGTTYSVGAMVGSDAVASVTQTPAGFSGGAAGTAQAGAYTVTPSAAVLGSGAASNYNFVYVDSTHTVNKANATVTGNSGTVIYNGANQSVTGFTASGLVGGETESVLTSVNASRTAKNAGTYAVTPSGTDANYNLSFVNGALVIQPAVLTLTTTTNTKSFDGNTSAQALPTVSGLKGSDTISNLSQAYADASPGNGKTLLVQGSYRIDDGQGGANYAVTLEPDRSGVIRGLPVAVLPPAASVASTANFAQPAITVASSTSGSASGGASGNASAGSSPGVSVNTINQASQQIPGLVAVLVPSGTATVGTGLVIALPAAIVAPAQEANLPVSVTLPDSQPLPSWIRYDASTQSLITTAVPAGAFPISVLINIGSQSTVVQISETTSGR